MKVFFRPASSKVIYRLGFAGGNPRSRLPGAAVSGETPPAMPDSTIHTCGKVLEQAGPALYRVSLPNGKVILAHLSKRLADENAVFTSGDSLLLELTPYDFDTARILGLAP
jgi:translation initiation factor IF-1